jgi:hypothetical protein
LLQSYTTPRGHASEPEYASVFEYDNDGRLTRDTDARLKAQVLFGEDEGPEVGDRGRRVTLTSPEGLVTTYDLEDRESGVRCRKVTNPAGLAQTSARFPDGRSLTSSPTGLTIESWPGELDPRWGAEAPVPSRRRFVEYLAGLEPEDACDLNAGFGEEEDIRRLYQQSTVRTTELAATGPEPRRVESQVDTITVTDGLQNRQNVQAYHRLNRCPGPSGVGRRRRQERGARPA